MNNNCAVLVSSSDSYSDLGVQLEKNYMKYWPDCSMKVYFVTNTAQVTFKKFIGLTTGPDFGWSDSLALSLDKIAEEYVWLMLEDCFLTKRVNNHVVNEALEFAIDNNISCLHPRYWPKDPKNKKNHANFVIYESGFPYSVNAYALWNVSTLKKCLKLGESAGEFETKGNARFMSLGQAGSVLSSIFEIQHLVIRGKWKPGIRRVDKKYQFNLDLDKRPFMSPFSILKYGLISFVFNFVMNRISWKKRKKIVDLINKIMVVN